MAARNPRPQRPAKHRAPPSGGKDRKDRIIDVAIRLAEQGGFDNVRQRDVAAQAGVALGTLYKSFRGKEDILAAALERVLGALERRLERKPVEGGTAVERLTSLFQMLTTALCRRPNYARAVLRAMASGEPEVAANVVAYQLQIYRMIVAAMRGDALEHDAPATAAEMQVALLLQQIWFAGLVGWSAKLHGQARVVEQVSDAAALLLAGIASLGGWPGGSQPSAG
jgi:AcrR family transcriptional regulator